MGCKALPVLVMFLVTILLMSAEVAPRDLDEIFDQNDGKLNPTETVAESKYGRGGFGGRGGYGGGFGGRGGYGRGFGGPWRGGYGGGFGGPWRGGYGGPWGGGYGGYCPFGCCGGWGYYGGCYRCCYYPGERAEANIDAKPYD